MFPGRECTDLGVINLEMRTFVGDLPELLIVKRRKSKGVRNQEKTVSPGTRPTFFFSDGKEALQSSAMQTNKSGAICGLSECSGWSELVEHERALPWARRLEEKHVQNYRGRVSTFENKEMKELKNQEVTFRPKDRVPARRLCETKSDLRKQKVAEEIDIRTPQLEGVREEIYTKPLSSSTSMPKRKSRRKVDPDPSENYSPRLSKEQKAVNHRKASAEYYARNPQIREKRRVQAAEKRAGVKLKRRRWDPPKKNRGSTISPEPEDGAGTKSGIGDAAPVEENLRVIALTGGSSGISHPGLNFASEDPRVAETEGFINAGREYVDTSSALGAVVGGSAASPTSDERLVIDALATLANGVAVAGLGNTDAVDQHSDSILHLADRLSSLESSVAALPVGEAPNAFTDPLQRADLGCLPSGVTPLTRMQEMNLRITGSVGSFTQVQVAQINVAKLNAREFVPATREEATQCRVAPALASDPVIDEWRLRVAEELFPH
ncbi:hypothetical protein C8R44DRAFT_730444 [Mycena epipterygia]|nr:hypothetical protein C8R44DRAFT_730444 [Mycena epipterygia]